MDLYQMVLNIIPGNIISPFQTGNALQIIFLACICGAGTLVLGDPAVCIYLHDESVFIR